MHPILLQFGLFTISSYGAAMATAFLLSVWLLARESGGRLKGLVPMSPDQVSDWATWTIVGGILGGRVLYVILEWPYYAANPLEILAVWKGGLVWYGGFFGGLITGGSYLRRHKISFLRSMDQVIPFGALGHAIGRIGCFLNGCCFGKPTTAWWGVQFPEYPHPVIPTQLLESGGLFFLFLWLRSEQRADVLRAPGALFGRYLVAYGLLRWTIETWRDMQPIVWGGITVSQAISVIIGAVGVVLLIRSRRAAAGLLGAESSGLASPGAAPSGSASPRARSPRAAQ